MEMTSSFYIHEWWHVFENYIANIGCDFTGGFLWV